MYAIKENNMTTTTASIAINEEEYLYRNGLIGIFAGFMFLINSLNFVLQPLLEVYGWLYFLFGTLNLAIVIILIKTLVKLSISGRFISKEAFWFGLFEDEYFNHINNQGYKYTFHIILTYLVLFSFIGDHFKSITLEGFCEFGLALSFLTYGATVMFLLKAKDE